ncbi:hypothetical protein BC629DRAFT_1589976 [Irpex lacteus]|nr:hypothetical protein BC629DRAFT_1589976 [Irpex lacteus]
MPMHRARRAEVPSACHYHRFETFVTCKGNTVIITARIPSQAASDLIQDLKPSDVIITSIPLGSLSPLPPSQTTSAPTPTVTYSHTTSDAVSSDLFSATGTSPSQVASSSPTNSPLGLTPQGSSSSFDRPKIGLIVGGVLVLVLVLVLLFVYRKKFSHSQATRPGVLRKDMMIPSDHGYVRTHEDISAELLEVGGTQEGGGSLGTPEPAATSAWMSTSGRQSRQASLSRAPVVAVNPIALSSQPEAIEQRDEQSRNGRADEHIESTPEHDQRPSTEGSISISGTGTATFVSDPPPSYHADDPLTPDDFDLSQVAPQS